MLCDKCKVNEATFHSRSIINGVETEQHLCGDCASDLSINPFSMFAHDYLFGSDLDMLLPFGEYDVCDCGMGFDDIVNSGRVGCDNCYSNYHKLLSDAVKSINIGARNADKIVSKKDIEISKLRAELEDAVSKEDYEKASELKKKIDKLMKGDESNE